MTGLLHGNERVRRCLCGVVFFFASLFGALEISAGSLAGTVRSAQSNRPLDGVVIVFESSGRATSTDQAGAFRFDSVPPGSCNLLLHHDAMEPLRLNDIFIAGDAEKRLDIEMNPRLSTIDTVTIRGSSFRKAPDMASSSKIMTFDEILRMPGGLVDVQRAVQNLPSVSSAGDNTNEIIVRGGNRGENLIVMDNIELPNPNHFADQGSGGGAVSLINPLLVKGLTFSAGAPPAQYGGKASSVLDVKLREGNKEMVVGGVDAGMAGAGIHIEGPLWRGATFMASATKSYLNLFARFAATTAIPSYWGGQAKLTQTAGNHKLSANLIYGDNGIAIVNAAEVAGTDGDQVKAGGVIYATGFNWETQWNERLSSVTTVSAVGNGFDRLEYADPVEGVTASADTYFVNTSFEREQTLRSVWSLDVGQKSRVSAGLSAKRCGFDEQLREKPFDSAIGDPMVTSLDGQGYKFAGFVSAIFYPAERFKIIPGIRCDHFTVNSSTTVAPRLGLVYSLSPQLDMTAAGGLQYQEPDYVQLAASDGGTLLEAKRVATGICGIEYSLSRYAARFVAEVFYKQYDRAPVTFELTTSDPADRSNRYLSIGSGNSYGLELFAHKKLTDRFSGSAAYALSRSWQDDVRPGHQGERLRGEFDFRNMITLTAGYKIELIGKAWYKKLHNRWWMIAVSPIMPIADRMELSVKWRFLGGRPRTESSYDEALHQWIERDDDYLVSSYPAYHRLDLRFERRYGFGFLQMIYYFDFQNIYNRPNIWTYMYSDRRGSATPIYQFSFFPAGGIIIGF